MENGSLNRVDTFLAYYGNGDTQKGLQYIRDDLRDVDIGSHYIARGEDNNLEFIFETMQDELLLSNAALRGESVYHEMLKISNAYQVFEESERRKAQEENKGEQIKSIPEVMQDFLRYLEEGMSK